MPFLNFSLGSQHTAEQFEGEQCPNFCSNFRRKEKQPEIFMQVKDLTSVDSFTDIWYSVFLSTWGYTGCIY